MKHSTRWFKSTWDAAKQDEFDKLLGLATPVLSRLAEILQEDLETSYRKARDEGNFSEASWSQHQAYLLGEQKNIVKLLTLLKQDN